MYLEFELFWFYAIFTVPLMCVFIDIIFYQLHLNFFPSNEMIFLDSEYEEKQREKKGESLSQEDADVLDLLAQERAIVRESDVGLVEMSSSIGEEDTGQYVLV